MTSVTQMVLPSYKLVQTMESAFPQADPGMRPVGSHLIVQLRSSARKTEAGIEIPDEVRKTIHDNNQTAKIIALGPLAFKNRETGQEWPEGNWADVGDYVRVPLYAKETWMRPGPKDSQVTFCMIDDLQVIGVLAVSPLEFEAFL